MGCTILRDHGNHEDRKVSLLVILYRLVSTSPTVGFLVKYEGEKEKATNIPGRTF